MPPTREPRWDEVERVLDRALEAPPTERMSLVATACAGDPTLESRVGELLAAALRAENGPDPKLASLAPDVYDAALTHLGDSAALRPGSRVGAYRIVGSLGVGGMGEVYLAQRADGQFERRVAIKVLSGLRTSAAGIDRFHRERQILAELHHDHIAPLFDGGVTRDGRPFFVLQYVDGLPITEYCAERRLGLDERVALFLQACDALQYAHSQGVVHRDLKPANLLVCDRDDGPPHLSVLDFGIARLAGSVELTRTGDVLGTPAYMAPEQARGELEAVDRRADVFALGVLLYELFCNRRPFEGTTPVETLAAVLRADPTSPRAWEPTLPRDLEVVVLSCLERSPDRRYASVRDLADDLKRYLAGEPIAARGLSPARRLVRRIRRRPLLWSIVFAALLSAAVAGAMRVREQSLARRGAEMAGRYGQLAEEIAATMRFEHLLALHDTAPARRRMSLRLSALEAEMDEVPDAARSSVLLALGRGYLALGQLDQSLRYLDEAWASGLDTPTAALTLAEAEVERYRRDRSAAETLADPGLRTARLAQIAARSRDRALHLRDLADRDSERGELVAAQIAFLEGDHDLATRRLRSALEVAPWRYEALLLEGEIEISNLEVARGEGRTDEVVDLLQDARLALRQAAEIAASDPLPHLQLCRLATLEVELRLHDLTGAGDAAAKEGAAACESAQHADSGLAAGPIAESSLRVAYARDLSRRDRDPFDEIGRAIAAAERGVELSSSDALAHRRLGDAWVFRAEFERERGLDSSASIAAGAESLERAAQLAPDDSGVWNSLGLLRWEEVLHADRKGQDIRPSARAAAAAFERAVEIEPTYAYSWGNLGTMLNWLAGATIEAGEDALPQLEAAESALRRALEIYPAYVTAHNNLGNVAHNRGEVLLARDEDAVSAFRAATDAFDEVLVLKPDWAFPRFNRARSGIGLALARLQSGEDPADDLVAAREALGVALEMRSDLVDAHLLAAELETMQARRALRFGESPDEAFRNARDAIATARSLDPEAGEEQEQELVALEEDAALGG